jgi:hypothetical protein
LRTGCQDHDRKKLEELERKTRKLLAGWGDGGGSREGSPAAPSTSTTAGSRRMSNDMGTGSLPRQVGSSTGSRLVGDGQQHRKLSASRTSSGGVGGGYGSTHSSTLNVHHDSTGITSSYLTTPRKPSSIFS